MKRYKVAITEGWSVTRAGRSGSHPPGLTASVLDTKIIHREVRRFRSEDRVRGFQNRVRGPEGAIHAALEYADKLNAECERT